MEKNKNAQISTGDHVMVNKINYRKTNIEMLRIFSMFVIVCCHFAFHGNYLETKDLSLISKAYCCFLELGGSLGVDVFVLISGYFFISDSSVKPQKILFFLSKTILYSIFLFFLAVTFHWTKFSIKEFIFSLFPICFGQWWFASCWFLLYLFHPFLNKCLQGLEKKQYQNLLCLFFLVWSILPTMTSKNIQSNKFLIFIFLYSIAGYIRLFGLNLKFRKKHYFLCWIIFCLLRFVLSFGFVILEQNRSGIINYRYVITQEQSVFTILEAISIFMLFASMEVKNNSFINSFAGCTFGIYLIHDNQNIRFLLWKKIFLLSNDISIVLFIFYSVIFILLVFISCAILDFCVGTLINKVNTKIINWNGFSTFDMLIGKCYRKVVSFLFGTND